MNPYEKRESFYNTKTRFEDNSGIYIPLPDDPAEAWWQAEVHMLHVQHSYEQNRAAFEERAKTWMACTSAGAGLIAFCVALYAIRYLK